MSLHALWMPLLRMVIGRAGETFNFASFAFVPWCCYCVGLDCQSSTRSPSNADGFTVNVFSCTAIKPKWRCTYRFRHRWFNFLKRCLTLILDTFFGAAMETLIPQRKDGNDR